MYNCKRPDLIYANGIKDEPTDFAIFLIGRLLPFSHIPILGLPYWNVQQSQAVDRLGNERQSIRLSHGHSDPR